MGNIIEYVPRCLSGRKAAFGEILRDLLRGAKLGEPGEKPDMKPEFNYKTTTFSIKNNVLQVKIDAMDGSR